jgi:tRNA A-37 threonylcarbamoyl transferase component Bud32
MPDVVRPLPNPKRRLGRYRLIATLGQGGMGTIHLGVSEGIGGFRKLFVIKELKQELTLNDQFLEMFMREAKLAARLNHPNVVHTIEADHESGRYYLAMDFLDGQPFNEVLWHSVREPVAPLALRLQVLSHALAGLHHAHELRDYDGRALHVVHRDVSPANIFVGYDGQVKMLDFGIAKAADMEGTRPGEFKGKISYAAPEQLRGFPADRRVDVFAAGVVLWEALAMRRLVQGKPSRGVFEARLLGTEPRIRQILPDLDPALALICDRAMHADPGQRYPTAEAFRVALQEYLSTREQGMEPALIARFMQAKFASARAALHRVIDAELHSEGDDPATGLVSLPALASPAHAIALRAPSLFRSRAGELASAERRAEYPPASLGRLRHTRRNWGRVFAALAVASVAAAFAAYWSSEPGHPREEAPAARGALPKAPVSAPQATPPAETTVSPTEAAPVQEPPAATRTAREPSPALEAAASDAGAETVAGEAAHTLAQDPAPDSPAAAAEPSRSEALPPEAATASPRGRAGGAARERTGQGPAPSKAASGSVRDAASAPPPPLLDLRSVPRRQQRELDLENPFRK